MTAIDLLILALATWRLSSLLAQEDGPYDMFAKLRRRLGVRYDAHRRPSGENVIARGVICVWCNSVWVGAALALAYFLWPAVVWLCLPLALSAAAIVIDQQT